VDVPSGEVTAHGLRRKKSDLAITKDFAFADSCGQLFSAGSVTGQRRRRTVPNGEQRAASSRSREFSCPPSQGGKDASVAEAAQQKREKSSDDATQLFNAPG
jgi:hypothetical protein